MTNKVYTKKDLVAFGNYVLSNERKESLKKGESSVPVKDRAKEVHDADFANWKKKSK